MDAIGTLLTLLGIFLLYQIAVRVLSKTLRRRLQFPTPAFFDRILDSGFRKFLQPPERVVERSGIGRGIIVLDLGCGGGALTIPMARAVGPSGRVYAVDINPGMLRRLEEKLARPENSDVRGIVEVVNASAYDLPFEDGSVDACCMVTVLGEIPDRERALREVKRVLRPGGILAVTEVLVDPDYLPKSTVVRMGEEAGFSLEEIRGNLWDYTVRFRRP